MYKGGFVEKRITSQYLSCLITICTAILIIYYLHIIKIYQFTFTLMQRTEK